MKKTWHLGPGEEMPVMGGQLSCVGGESALFKRGVNAGGFPGEPGRDWVWVGEDLAEQRSNAGWGIVVFVFLFMLPFM